ncbi:MAG TPA: hypothetical protein VE090_03860 [Methylomirabilota bacterium]|nr:hypothetical protein [Methylomirabilota bacterium]
MGEARFPHVIIDRAKQYIKENGKKSQAFLIEERIDPPPAPGLAKHIKELRDKTDLKDWEYREFQPEDLDFNFRVITTLSLQPEIIDAEVRYHLKDDQPVNVSKGAGALRTHVLQDPELVAKAHATARQAVAAVYRHVQKKGEAQSLPNFVGVDLIPGQDGKVYVMEVQGGPGGFGTLAEIDGKPNQAISKVLIPAQEKVLQKHVKNRKPIHPEHLRSIPPNGATELIRHRSYYQSENFPAAQEAYYNFLMKLGDFSLTSLVEDFGNMAEETGDYTYALRYANDLIAREPDNPLYQEYKTKFEELSRKKEQ